MQKIRPPAFRACGEFNTRFVTLFDQVVTDLLVRRQTVHALRVPGELLGIDLVSGLRFQARLKHADRQWPIIDDADEINFFRRAVMVGAPCNKFVVLFNGQ